MHNIHNGRPAADPGTENWVKPWSNPNGGSCRQALKLPGGRVALRQSADPASPALILEHDEIRAFIEGAKAGLAGDLLKLTCAHRPGHPCDGTRGKHPCGRWTRDSTANPHVIRAALARGPRNLAIDCAKSGLLVIDAVEL